jgi:predicted RNase H-like nuclease (RuvC/YqgF family)
MSAGRPGGIPGMEARFNDRTLGWFPDSASAQAALEAERQEYAARGYSSPAMRSSNTSTTSSTSTVNTVPREMDAASSSMAATVPELQAEVRDLEAENEALTAELEETRGTLEHYERAIQDDAALEFEIRGLREFIEDVRLGIRDLDEYERVCS